jgi:hypothetical protein
MQVPARLSLALLIAFLALPASAQKCDPTLWKHVYHGKFATGKDRLNVIKACITVTGTVMSAPSEADGDYHIRIKLDTEFKSLLNAKNKSGQHGFLVAEPMCEVKPKQQDTLDEGVCKGFNQTIFKRKTTLGKRVQITGAYVQDREHGWREIHPVTSIKIIE